MLRFSRGDCAAQHRWCRAGAEVVQGWCRGGVEGVLMFSSGAEQVQRSGAKMQVQQCRGADVLSRC